MIAILAVIDDGGRAIVVIYREGVEINYFLLYFFDSAKTLQRRPSHLSSLTRNLDTGIQLPYFCTSVHIHYWF
jgi:hypothetical protein